ncbi:hypothetical protein AOCH_002725 [Aspergillus ochraceoroseus]|uniref:FAD dependent oxidoreductase domain-containing protein n=2 Tax=Aspergillus ochraceoroseus TaxID=138278 RepID=A0A0F8U807_9EURO|nr:hypothetical protein AOCH_002725 [Aspergillus ochraceoroseus]
MPTVILGGGIIGASIAYQLTEKRKSNEEIHIFAPSLLPLGKLSFDMHGLLAAEHGGDKKWGYMKGTALSLGSTNASSGEPCGHDWLFSGTSRAETATSEPILTEGPGWLTTQKETAYEQVGDETTVAQTDPLRLSQFLLDQSLARGAKLHQPSKALSLVTDKQGIITGITILNINTNVQSTLPCTNLVISGGVWSPRIFQNLFPSSDFSLPIYPLSGYSLVLRSPRYTLEHERQIQSRSHAFFTTQPPSCGFSPEIFSREGGEIYIAGLNSREIPVPDRVDDVRKFMDKDEMDKLKAVMVRLMGKLPHGVTESTDELTNIDDLEILREGLCHRPVTERGVPLVTRLDDKLLGAGLKTAAKGGVFIAAGHGPWGISLSLGTGKVVADMIQGLKPAVDISGLGIQSTIGSKL